MNMNKDISSPAQLKKVFFDYQWKMHSSYKDLFDFPPDGYEFNTRVAADNVLREASKIPLSYTLFNFLSRSLPLTLIKSYLDKYFKNPPRGTSLTFATEHLVFRDEPWVVDIGDVANFVGGDYEHFTKYTRIIERRLASPYCKRILAFSTIAKRSLIANLNCQSFEHKIDIVPLSVHPKNFVKVYKDGGFKILFVNSANIAGEFEIKGGTTAIEAFILVKQKYPDLELVIRSDIPPKIKNTIRQLSGISLIEGVIPWEQLEHEFITADCFMLPTLVTPNQVFLDAMSYELPIITTDFYGNSELVQDGVTGFLVESRIKIPLSWRPPLHLDGVTSISGPRLNVGHERLADQIASKISILIENRILSREMGKRARWEIEHGKFSIDHRNKKLEKIFNEAVS